MMLNDHNKSILVASKTNYSYLKLSRLRLIFRAVLQILTVVSLLTVTFFASAETHQERVKKCGVIPVSVPSFSCKDGLTVPKKIDSKGHCSKPENLYARCVYKSTLGQLEKSNNKGVEIYFSCRKEPKGSETYSKDGSNKYYDIAVIQFDKNTGNTCFYQHEGEVDGDNIPAPKDDTKGTFWNSKPDFCTSCHSNGPFVRTPHYQEVETKADPSKLVDILPSVYRRKPGKHKYRVLHDHYEVYDLARKDNACLGCHSIGAYKPLNDFALGQVNKLAAGTITSLREGRTGPDCYSPRVEVERTFIKNGKEVKKKIKVCPSPTDNGFHDFMLGQYDMKRPEMEKAIKELEECTRKPKTAGCTLTKLSP